MPVEYVEAVQDHIGAMQARAVSGDVDEGSGTCANRGVAQELRSSGMQLYSSPSVCRCWTLCWLHWMYEIRLLPISG